MTDRYYPNTTYHPASGKILEFSFEHFMTEIVKGNACFMCGALPEEKTFNDEHIIPNWILRKFKLHSEKIDLPNRATVLYGSYKIPCCQECNTFFANNLESKIARIFTGPHCFNNAMHYLNREGPKLLFVWLALIFLKIHLYDAKVNFNLDRRSKRDITIGDRYNWMDIEHTICVARSLFTGCQLDPRTYGSFFVVPARYGPELQFDHMDFFSSSAIMVKVLDVCIICILNDAGYYNVVLEKVLRQLKLPLSAIQCRELFARYGYMSQRIKERAEFITILNQDGSMQRVAQIPSGFQIIEGSGQLYGEFLCAATDRFGKDSDAGDADPATKQQIEEFINERKKAGTWSYIFDDNGKFVEEGVYNLLPIDARLQITHR